jgi:cell division protein FtsW
MALPPAPSGDAARALLAGAAPARPSAARPQALPILARGPDLIFLAAVLALVGVGSIEIYSSSAVYALAKFGSSTYFLARQSVYVGAGLGALLVGAQIDYRRYRRYIYTLLFASLALLGAVLVFGARVNEARRWFHFGPLSFQPVEVAKLALILYLAYSLAKKREKVKYFTVGFMPHLAVCGAMMGLLLKQPDLGSCIILGVSTLVLLFIAGAKLSYLLLSLLAALPLVYHSIVSTAWRLRRLLAYLDPWQFRRGTGYQITESLIAVGSGGMTGLGLGDGKQKLFYLPEAHTDFILSSIGEELGFVGIAAVLVLFAVVLWRGVRAALGARDAFGTYLAIGLTTVFALQALVNTGVVLGALPAKGLTLPFVSYGGTSLVVSMFFAGIILNVSKSEPEPAPAPERERALANRKKRRRVRVIV